MKYVPVVVLLALLEFLVLGFMVGRARAKYGVKAPAISGHEIFERHFRVHYNTLEQLVIFLPAIWLFGVYVHDLWGATIGAVFVVGRLLYAVGYVANPSKRAVGFALGFVPVIVLLLGALYGAGRQALQ
jgi:glutathione S-transferase